MTEEQLDHVRRALSTRLSSIYETWTLDGKMVKGPGSLAVYAEDHHKVSAHHVDIGFTLNQENAEAPVLWDCAAGLGATPEGALNRAVETWTVSTLPVFLEMLHRDGTFADHFNGADPAGCPGWHVIHGPITAFGGGEAPKRLQAWVLQNQLLALVGPAAIKSFDRPILNCVKLLFGFGGGEDVAEVRVNGLCDTEASERLRALPWPRSSEVAFARCFLLFVHSE